MELSPGQHDILKELINIGVGKAAALINQMVKAHVTLTVPEIVVLSQDEMDGALARHGDAAFSTVRMGFRGAFSGSTALIFPRQSVAWLVSQLLGDQDGLGLDMDSLRIGTIQEVGNIVLNGVMGSIVNILRVNLDYYPPDYVESDISGLFASLAGEHCMALLIKTHFILENGVAEGEVIIVFQVTAFDDLIKAMDTMMG
jgi:chemotaxis protein CheC